MTVVKRIEFADERVQALVRDGMKNGGYYPRELENAVKTVFGDEISSVLCEPNNILGIFTVTQHFSYV